MKAASLKLIKTELDLLHPEKVKDLCLQLIKFKKENKELLSYLLYFSAPKQTKTREARVENCIPQILNGKGLNDLD